MKMINKTQITTWALRAYMVYSITADLILLGGIAYGAYKGGGAAVGARPK